MANEVQQSKQTEGGSVAHRGGYPHPIHQFRDEMDRLFDGFFGRPFGGGLLDWDWEPFRAFPRSRAGAISMPQIAVREADGSYVIEAELPGMSEKDIDLELRDDVLMLKGEKKAETKEEKENYILNERSWGTFQRSFRLPDIIDREKVNASFKNGVLTITLPKSEKAKASTKKIQIQG